MHNSRNKSAKSKGGFQKPMRRRRRAWKAPAGHPTDAELIASYTKPVTKCPDGVAMGSMRSFDMGLAG